MSSVPPRVFFVAAHYKDGLRAVLTPVGRRESSADTWSSAGRGGYVGGTGVNERVYLVR